MASTVWWICSKCAFWNYPRLNQDAKLCQQCGKGITAEDADYEPSQGGRR